MSPRPTELGAPSDVELMAPRQLDFITVKRNAALAGRSYGHWWIEVDGIESYGWWPARSVRVDRLFRGVPGVLNGLGDQPGGSPTRDPNHGLLADHEFHPVLTRPCGDDDVRLAIRTFASTFEGEWRLSTRQCVNCRIFQLLLFDAVGIVDGTGNYGSRGTGCPALAPSRRMVGRWSARRRWPWNLPEPGRRVALGD